MEVLLPLKSWVWLPDMAARSVGDACNSVVTGICYLNPQPPLLVFPGALRPLAHTGVHWHSCPAIGGPLQ